MPANDAAIPAISRAHGALLRGFALNLTGIRMGVSAPRKEAEFKRYMR